MELIILAVPLLLLWFMVSRGRRQQRELIKTQDAVAPGTRVMTTSGMFAEVVAVETDAVILEIAPGVHTRWTRRAIGQVLPASDPDTDSIQDPDASETAGSTAGPAATGREDIDIRSEAGYAAPAEAEVTEGSTGTTGTTGTDGR